MTRTGARGLVVVGDTLLDVDIDGSSNRLSPDAGVPVVEGAHRRMRPGGAGLAALLAARTGLEVTLITAIGSDPAGDLVRELLEARVRLYALPLAGSTVCKTRIQAGNVPVLRLDTGTGLAASAPPAPQIGDVLNAAPLLLVADYGRGMARLPELREALQARAAEVPLVWDPHPRGPSPVPGAALVTPNLAEAAGALGRAPADATAAEERRRATDYAGRLITRWQARAVAVTIGARGAVLAESEPPHTRVVVPEVRTLPARRDPAGVKGLDTCGAGDQFAVAAAAALGAGADPVHAVQTAVDQATAYVLAGGSAVAVPHTGGAERAGQPELLGATGPGADAFAVAERVRQAGGRLVATGGCFDLLHRGHVQLLAEARRLGDALVVCLNSDASVRRHKGATRPVVTQEDRARVLAALVAVDAVAVFDEDTPDALLSRLRPDVWVKGADYAGQPIAEAATVRRYGGDVVLLPLLPGYSTTQLVSSVRGVEGDPAALMPGYRGGIS